MTILTLLLVILLAAPVFAATQFSGAQVYLFWNRRWLRLSHGFSVLATLAWMAALQIGSGTLSVVAGVPLLVSSGTAFCPEKRWNRLLPPFQFAFAVVLTMFPVLAVG